MQYILGHCINQGRQTPDTTAPPFASPPSVCTVRLFLSSPPSSPLPLLMLIILSVLPPSPGIFCFSLLTFTHYWIQTYIRVPLFARCAATPLTILQTGSLSSFLSGLKIAPFPSRVYQIPSQLRLMLWRQKQCCRYTTVLLCACTSICITLSLA